MGQTQGGGHHVATHELEASLPAELSYDYFRDWLEASRPRVWSPELFHALKDPKAGHIRRDDFLKELDERTHVFLSHDMETDELGRDNYERMERVNAWLKSRGIVTWFRGDRRRPPALQQHFHAIDRCGLVVVFVTKAYCDKVQGLHGEIDQVRREYNACCHLKTYKFMVSVVQEPRCRDVWRWQGPVGLVGGNLCSINDDDDPKAFEESMQKLFKRIKKKIDTTFFTDVAIEHGIDPVAVLASKSGKKLVVAPLVPVPVPPEQRRCEEALFQWLLEHCGPHLGETSAARDASAEVYKALFREADERTLARVGKRVGKEPEWLHSLHEWLCSLVEGDTQVRLIEAELQERNALRLAVFEAYLKKQEEDIETYKKAQAEQDERENGARRRAADRAAAKARAAAERAAKKAQDFASSKLEWPTGTCEGTLKGHARLAMCVMQLKEGGNNARLVSGSSDPSLKMWDVALDGYAACVKTFLGHHKPVTSLCQINPHVVCSSSADGTIKLWDLRSEGHAAQLKTLQGYAGGVNGVIHLSTNKGVVLAMPGRLDVSRKMPTATHDDSEDDDDDVEEKNDDDGEEEKGNGAPYNGDDGAIVTRKSDTHLEAKGGAPSSPGTSLLDTEGAGAGAGPGADAEGSGLLCSAGEDGVVRIWEHASGACLKALHGHEGEVYAVAELSQSTRTRGLLLATAGEDATVRVWSPAGIRGRCLQVLRGHTNDTRVVIELNYPTLTKLVVDSATASYTSRSHHSSRSLRTQESARLKALEDAARVPDWKEVEDVVCSGSLDQTVKVWHWPSGRCVRTLPVGTGVCALTQLRNGRLVVAGDTPVVTLWNWVAGACEVTLDGHCNYVRCVTQLADGRVCTGSMDNTLKLWR